MQIALSLAHDHGLMVHSVTCDCTNVIPRTMTLLGCKWLGAADELSSKLSPQYTDGAEVHLVLDACHLLKLARNALAHVKVMRYGDGGPIKWHHILLLQDIQQQEAIVGYVAGFIVKKMMAKLSLKVRIELPGMPTCD